MERFVLLSLAACGAVPVVEVSVEAAGRSIPVTWRPGEEDVFMLARRFQEKHWEPHYWELQQQLRLRRAEAAARGGDHVAAEFPLKRGERLQEPNLRTRQSVISLYIGHDASVAVSQNGRVQCVLELERLFEERYFRPSTFDLNIFHRDWLRALRTVQSRCDAEEPLQQFTNGVIVFANARDCSQLVLMTIVEEIFSVDRWHFVDHHEAHALLGFWASPFRSALIISYDSSGNDGSFNAYVAQSVGPELRRIAQLDYSMGAYEQLATLLPEVTGIPLADFFDCSNLTSLAQEPWALIVPRQHYFERSDASLSWAGKLMGYAATGQVDEELRPLVRFFFEAVGAFPGVGASMPRGLVAAACGGAARQRAVGATVQEEFQSFVKERVQLLLEHVGVKEVDGLVITGGCALNVLTNQLLHDSLGAAFYVPAAPNDSGLTVGGLWSVAAPRVRQPLQYLGFRLWDEALLPQAARNRGAVRLASLGGVEYLAQLLAGEGRGNWSKAHPIVAVVRGRQEFGPRALGHRSLLAVPSAQMRERMNELKARAWYRPVAPMVAEEAMPEIFGRSVASPFMTMAPEVQPEVRRRFPDLAHLDGTARHQSVSPQDEPWVHALLLAVGRRTGLAALINTSFNTKGKPIVNTVRECLRMLDELPNLDYVLIEDWLFRKSPAAQRLSAAKMNRAAV